MDTKQGWWVVFGATLTLTITAGVGLYSLVTITPIILEDMGWSLTKFTMATSLWAISAAIYCPLCGYLIERFGVRIVVLLGIIGAAITQYFMGQVQNLPQFALVMFLTPIAIMSCYTIPIATLVSHWFNEHRGKAIGVAMLGIGIGGGISPRLTNALVEAHGWRGAMTDLAFIFLLALIPALIWLRSPKGHATAKEELEHLDESPELATSLSLKEAIRTRTFWTLSLGDMLYGAAFTSITFHWRVYLTHDTGDITLVLNVLSIFLLCIAFGSLLFGWLADNLPFRLVIVSAYFLPSITFLILLIPNQSSLLYVFAIFAGLAGGGRIALIPLALGKYFGLVHLAAIFGLSSTLFMIGNAIGPVIAASIFDATGDTRYIYCMLIVLLLLASLLMSTIRNEQKNPTD